MRRILLAIRIFFRTLFNAPTADRVEAVLKGPALTEVPPAEKPLPAPPKDRTAPRPPARSEALTLLAALQREARFVDFVNEPLDGYTDAQIGAVARDVHRDCGAVLKRLFGLRPVISQPEGSEIELPAEFDAGRFRLTGNVTEQPSLRGQVAHHGWEAASCELPTWTGSDEAARIVAQAEIEVK